MKRKTKIYISTVILALFVAFFLSCQGKKALQAKPMKGITKMDIQKQTFGHLPDGSEVEIYILTNSHGLKAKIMTYGATLVALEVPDRQGELADIVLGHDSLEGYLDPAQNPYFGSIVGRYANRIAKAKFTLDGVEYRLAANAGKNHLHGGLKGFDKALWTAEPVRAEGAVGLKLFYLSRDGEEGYPGNLSTTVTYWLTEEDELKISYQAETDKPTPINLTSHSYFNLAGPRDGDILRHELMLNADHFTWVNDELLPTGEIRAVSGTPWDFTKPKAIGAEMTATPGGYDHNFVLRGEAGTLRLAARVYEPTSGRVMEIYTTEPGIQFYGGNFLDGTIIGKGGQAYPKHAGFCLETQHFPDSPNQPNFPSTILRPGQKYTSLTVHKFSAKRMAPLPSKGQE
ncbi:MAG: aldose epimerase family protein [Candidatus Aminicenantales bacterium]